MDELKPYQQIEALVELRSTWSDRAILDELTALPVLPDEDDPVWDDDRTWRDHAYLYVAHTEYPCSTCFGPTGLALSMASL